MSSGRSASGIWKNNASGFRKVGSLFEVLKGESTGLRREEGRRGRGGNGIVDGGRRTRGNGREKG